MADNERPRRQTIEHFDDSYTSTDAPPWDIGRPQAAFERIAPDFRGPVLDAGCGTGEHALFAAAQGLDVVGIDFAPTAIKLAQEKAAARGLAARFAVWDALDLPRFGERFDTVLDCGLFHVFDDEPRSQYVASLAGVVNDGGRVYMLCFSTEEPGDWGPRRVHPDEIRASFSDGWHVDAIEATTLEITVDPGTVQALLSTITRGTSVR
jgi:cyclopropane fatty-acyl-phospholipid synthase-like methyltransferase